MEPTLRRRTTGPSCRSWRSRTELTCTFLIALYASGRLCKKKHTRGNVDAIVISQVDRGVLVFYPPPQGDCHPTRNVSVRDCVFEADRLKYPYLSPARCDPVYSAKSSGGDNGYPAELGTAEGEVVDGDIRLVCAAVRCR